LPGSSPAKFFSLEEILAVKDGLEKMALVHEISVEPNFSVEDLQPKNPIHKLVRENMHQAFWDVFRENMEKQPPDHEHAFVLLNDLKEVLRDFFKYTSKIRGFEIVAKKFRFTYSHFKNKIRIF
jgi:hypothetical protein